MKRDLVKLNKKLENESPEKIIQWGLKNSRNPILTTNFRPYEAAIIHLCIEIKPDIKIIWCDTGYNTQATYIHAQKLILEHNLNIEIYTPKYTREYLNALMGGIPGVGDKSHSDFTKYVKLEPFNRAISEINPDLWITNLRIGQTNFRDSINILSEGVNNLLKISPFYNWKDKDLDLYMSKNKLENEFDYFDPTKVENNRECGLHK
ncbi:phosphoadenosine phosphosulfate reductase family protein [bacterium]|nr:phosphoadenosine phosphosulfate reductase family protein [bacterium]|tara:strand:+ start:2417 stop:3034 length:618 start_codon:yes stop_codon:yes gene_type:complete